MNKEALLSRIAEAEAQLEEMRRELNKKEVWEPEGGMWFVNGSGNVNELYSTENSRKFGIERKTKAAAEKARDEMRIYHRLLAYRDEFAPDYEPDWENITTNKWFVYLNGGKYCASYNSRAISVGCVYMPKDVAERLCRKLNSGEVML